MEIFDNISPSFINISGVIDEIGRVQLIPMFLSADQPRFKEKAKKSKYKLRLHYGDDGIHERFAFCSKIHTCDIEKKIELEYKKFWASMPLIKGSKLIQLLYKDKVIFGREIQNKPIISDISVKVLDNSIEVSWKAKSNNSLVFSIVLKFEDGKSTQIGITQKLKNVSFDLGGIPKACKASIQITASDSILCNTASSKSFELKATSPFGLILSPITGAKYEAQQPITLMANCYNIFGEQLKWGEHGLSWNIDGVLFSAKSAVELVKDLNPGKHKIELISEQWGVLSTSTIYINKPVGEFKKYERLFERY